MESNHPDILVVNELSVRFRMEQGEFLAVDRVSFTLKQGRTLGIVGESGSGKSVTAMALMKLLPTPSAVITAKGLTLHPQKGSSLDLLEANGRSFRHVRGNRISMIFQEPMSSLNPVVRCGNQVVEAIRAHRDITTGEARAITLDLFREVHFSDPEKMFRAYPHELSGGQRQRVMIAMAVSSRPDILIADEPTTALDVTVQKNIIGLLNELRAKYRMAMLFISHDLNLVASVADDIAVMQAGRIVETGPVSKILDHPAHTYTRSLLACRPPSGISLERLPTIADFTGGDPVPSPAETFRSLIRDENQYQSSLLKIYGQQPVVKTSELTVEYRGARGLFGKTIAYPALHEVTLEVYPGEVLGIVGESGCGKTTLGRTILRLKDARSGRVIFHGHDITSLSGHDLKKFRKDMQIIFQDSFASLNPRKTAGTALMEPMRVHHIGRDHAQRKELAMELLEKTGLERAHFYRYPHELSGGQRQRLCIARALAVRPKFIVCDESVSALDVSVQAQVLNLLKKLKKELGLTYIFITHDLSVVRFIADRVLVMKDGRILESGPTDVLFRSPENEYTRKMIDALPKIAIS